MLTLVFVAIIYCVLYIAEMTDNKDRLLAVIDRVHV